MVSPAGDQAGFGLTQSAHDSAKTPRVGTEPCRPLSMQTYRLLSSGAQTNDRICAMQAIIRTSLTVLTILNSRKNCELQREWCGTNFHASKGFSGDKGDSWPSANRLFNAMRYTGDNARSPTAGRVNGPPSET